jgi:hypothetical protein
MPTRQKYGAPNAKQSTLNLRAAGVSMSRDAKFGYGFLLVGVPVAYLLGKLLGSWIGALGAILCGIIGVWFLVSAHRHGDRNSQQEKRSLQEAQVAAEKALIAATSADRTKGSDWTALADRFKQLPFGITAYWSRYGRPATETWRVNSGLAGKECESLCRLAGAMLLRSPKANGSLDARIRLQPDSLYRWLYFLRQSTHLNNYMAATEVLDDGRKSTTQTACINDLAQVSMRACIDCAAQEMCPDDEQAEPPCA